MSIEPRTTRYTIKANVETTRYFNSPYPDIEEQVNENTNDISDLKSRMTTAEGNILTNKQSITNLNSNVSTNTTNISTNTTDITGLKTRMSTAEGKITTNTNDISNLKTRMTTTEGRLTTAEQSITTNTNNISELQTQISSISNNPYEGLFTNIYNGATALIKYNYNKGYIKYWKQDNSYWMAAINDSKSSGIQINDDIDEIILPSNVKQLNEDLTVAEYVKDIRYEISTGNNRKTLNSLKTLTTMPNVYSLDIKLSKAPKLCNFNLMNGLQVLKIEGLGSTSETDPIISLTIPSSVMECELKNINFRDLTFESGDNDYLNGLKLTYYNCQVRNKLTCKRDLKYNSSINANNSNIWAPNVLECTGSFLYYLSNSDSLGCAVIGSNTMNTTKTTLLLYYSILFDEPGTTWPGITFKSIFNYTYKSKSAFTNILYTSNWYPNA